ncbi:Liprin-beta-1 [Melipona quadrifasciata]|uniref:Liprin-beta-1 n=1 Tax=Melipona quadrifasciata TaxID=166423 RepID=A0A0N0U329_9HYME|nr:Liprin-beta-1 [Melipona quadrifasciata]
MGKSEERNGNTIQIGESTFLTKTSSEASKMLEAALLQMDDIISGVCTESNNEGNAEWKNSVKEATKNLVTAIKNSPSSPSPPDTATIEILLQWMQPVNICISKQLNSWIPSEEYDSSETSNSEQEENEFTNIDFFNHRIHKSGNCFCQEVLSRSALETQKLELLSSLSEMKLKQASLEHENLALRSISPMSNGEKFGRHTSQYSSLPRPPSTSKKGVMFGKVPSLVSGVHTTVPLAVKGVSARCLSAPTLAEEEKTIIEDSNFQMESIQKSLIELSMEEIGDWLTNLGLECYASELRRWGATGSKLLECSQQQLEKELEIKNVLHRKKLLYAIELNHNRMDNAAVLRWLDDIGLPQHKEAFQNGKVDGRMLHRLTTEDLLNLGVTAQLHAASLRRGIQILRELNFEFDNLERRSTNGNGADGSNVHLWTNHRVMEWLRVVDLAEYAPNMRGSGVHGGLMMYEGRFTSELLATILSISPGKTLLRRHLTTHFNQILGREVVQRKREIESILGFVPLTLTARLKVPKKSQFTLKRKKSKNEADYGNLVCPLEASPPGTPSTPTSTPGSPNLNSPTF